MKKYMVVILSIAAVVVLGIGECLGQSNTARPSSGRELSSGGAFRPGRAPTSHRTRLVTGNPKPSRRQSSGVLTPGVRRRVPVDFPTIQAAINACADGDTVLVSEGTYLENIRYRGKAIVVGSLYLIDGDTTHIEETIIDGSNPSHPDSGSVVSFIDGEDTTSVLCGLTIRGGSGTTVSASVGRLGGGVFCWESGARIVRNAITHNRVVSGTTGSGGGIEIAGSASVISYAVIEGNRVTDNFSEGTSVCGYSGGIDF